MPGILRRCSTGMVMSSLACLQKRGTPFELMTYPGAKHGLRGSDLLVPGLAVGVLGGALLTLAAPWWIRLVLG